MAKIEGLFTVVGGDDEIVTRDKSAGKSIKFGTPLALVLEVKNQGETTLTFPALTVVAEGPAKAKVTVALLQTALSVAAGQSKDVTVNVEAKQPVFKTDSIAIVVSGVSE